MGAMSSNNEQSEKIQMAEVVNKSSANIPNTLKRSASAPCPRQIISHSTPNPELFQIQIACKQQQKEIVHDSPTAVTTSNNGEIVDIDYDTKTSTDSIRICIDDEEMTEDMMQYKKRQSINSKQSYNPYLSAKNPRNTLSLNSAITRISVPSLMIPPGFSPGLSPDDLTPNTIGTITPDPNCMYGRHIDSYLTEQIVEEE